MNEAEIPIRQTPENAGDDLAQLVRQHADLVYAAARRQLGGNAMVDDVVQAVFILLWRKAGPIRGSIAGWLIKTTYFACLDARKIAARREFHEREAAAMNPSYSNPAADSGHETLAKVLDESLASLAEKDRDAVALRYLSKQSFIEVAATLGISEDAAKKRVARAIERLRKIMFAKISVPAAELAAHLESEGAVAAPQVLVAALIAAGETGELRPLAAHIVRSAQMRQTWLRFKIAAILLLLIGVGALAIYFSGAIDSNIAGGNGAPAGAPAGALTARGAGTEIQADVLTLDIRALIDGSDTMSLAVDGVSWSHRAFREPSKISINGQLYNVKDRPSLDDLGLDDADLSSAQVITRSGRGTIALEKNAKGIAVHFADPQNGASAYAMTIHFAHQPLIPTTTSATKPSADPVFLEVEGVIGGSDVLTISPRNGAAWQHVAMKSPAKVTINGKPWDVQARPTLDNFKLDGADFSTAEVVEMRGRDMAVMEKTSDGMAIYFGDAFGGSSEYKIKVRFARVK